MNFEIILILFVFVSIGICVYVVKFKDSPRARMVNLLLDKINPKRVEGRKETEEKKETWANIVNDMSLSELHNLRSKLIKQNSLLMKTGRDMKVMEAREELNMKQTIVEERIKMINSK